MHLMCSPLESKEKAHADNCGFIACSPTCGHFPTLLLFPDNGKPELDDHTLSPIDSVALTPMRPPKTVQNVQVLDPSWTLVNSEARARPAFHPQRGSSTGVVTPSTVGGQMRSRSTLRQQPRRRV